MVKTYDSRDPQNLRRTERLLQKMCREGVDVNSNENLAVVRRIAGYSTALVRHSKEVIHGTI